MRIADDKEFVSEVTAIVKTGAAALFAAIGTAAAMLVPNAEVDIETWAHENVVIPPSVSDRAGPYEMNFQQRFIAKLWQTPSVYQVTNIKIPRQGSSTQNVVGLAYTAYHRGRDAIYFERTEGDAQDFHDKKFIQIIEASPKLAALMRPRTKSGVQDAWSDIILKNGASIQFRAACNDSSFRGIKGAFLGLDEVGSHHWLATGKRQEGHRVSLALNRAQEFAMPMAFVGGSPTLKGSCIVSEQFELSNQCHYFMACPCCAEDAPWIEFLPDVRQAKDRETAYGGGIRYTVDKNDHPDAVWYECQQCGGQIEAEHKERMLNSGEFRSKAIGEPGHWGIFTWAAHCEDPQLDWIHIARKHKALEKNPSKLQVFVNTVLAQAFEPIVERVLDLSELESRAALEDWRGFDAPPWVKYVFAGGDVNEGNSRQTWEKDGRVEMVFVGVGESNRRALLDHVVISRPDWVDPATGEIMPVFAAPMTQRSRDEVLRQANRTFKTEDGRELKIRRTFLDAGHMNKEVLEFTSTNAAKRARITAVRGAKETFARRNLLPPKTSYSARLKREYLWLGTQVAKDTLERTLRIPAPGPESWVFAPHLKEATFRSMTIEQKVEVQKGVFMWKNLDERETGEVWDCMVYALAAEAYERQNSRVVDDVLRRIDQMTKEAAEEVAAAAERAKLAANTPPTSPAEVTVAEVLQIMQEVVAIKAGEKSDGGTVNPGRRVVYEILPDSDSQVVQPRPSSRSSGSRRSNQGTSVVSGIW